MDVRPTISHLQVFGNVCYVLVLDHLRNKFDKKRFVVFSWDITSKEKFRGVAI